MAPRSEVQFKDHLPAVFRRDEVEHENFLGRFLRAFEETFQAIQLQLDAIPDLFALVPAPSLVLAADVDHDQLQFDSAAGLCPGDVLQIRDPQTSKIEFVIVLEVAPELIPETVRLAIVPPLEGETKSAFDGKLRFNHTAGTPVRLVGTPARTTTLSHRADRNSEVLNIAVSPALGAAKGDVVRIDEGATVEFAEVTDDPTDGTPLSITPLQLNHEPGRAVALTNPLPLTTPPPQFAHLPKTMDLRGDRIGFLDWLAGWIGVHLRPDRDEDWNRELIRLAGPILPYRGTKRGVEAMLNAYLRGEATATVIDPADPDPNSDSLTGAAVNLPLHTFFVHLDFAGTNGPPDQTRILEVARGVLEREKPAHVKYEFI